MVVRLRVQVATSIVLKEFGENSIYALDLRDDVKRDWVDAQESFDQKEIVGTTDGAGSGAGLAGRYRSLSP